MLKHKHRMRIKGIESRRTSLVFGSYGFKAEENGELTLNHYNLIKKLLAKFFNKQVKVWYRAEFNHPKTARPLGARMGSGKSPVIYSVAKIYKGQIIFEWSYVSKDLNKAFVQALLPKFNIKVLCVERGL